MTPAQFVETSATNNSCFQNYPHPGDHTRRSSYNDVCEIYLRDNSTEQFWSDARTQSLIAERPANLTKQCLQVWMYELVHLHLFGEQQDLIYFFIQVSDLQPARVVFDVSLLGRACTQVVTLRSALMIKNKMDLPLEIKLQGLTSLHG